MKLTSWTLINSPFAFQWLRETNVGRSRLPGRKKMEKKN